VVWYILCASKIFFFASATSYEGCGYDQQPDQAFSGLKLFHFVIPAFALLLVCKQDRAGVFVDGNRRITI